MMEEQILKILTCNDELQEENGNVDLWYPKDCAKEIAVNFREFVEWIIHNTMEATTYSPMVYLKYQTKEEIGNHGGQFFDLSKEWYLDELYQYWNNEIKTTKN